MADNGSMPPTTEQFAHEAGAQISRAGHQRRPHVEINAGELHRLLDGYPGHSHRMPAACSALRSLMRDGDEVIYPPSRADGASFTVRYRLPR